MARRRVCQSRRVPPTRSGLAPRVTEGSPLFCETEALSAGGGLLRAFVETWRRYLTAAASCEAKLIAEYLFISIKYQ